MNKTVLKFLTTVLVKALYLLPALVLLPSCIGFKFKTAPLGDAKKLKKTSIIYSLPKTGFHVEVEITKTTVVPGPFYDYAKEFLGIEDVPREDTSYFSLTSVNLQSFEEPDTGQYYVISSCKTEFLTENLLTLTGQGLMLMHPPYMDKQEFRDSYWAGEKWRPYYTNLSVKRNVFEKIDTFYKTILQDTSFVRVPLIKKQLTQKSKVKKAEEAANFIIKLRKRRFKLIAGMYEKYPEGASLEVSVRELDELEEEYLSLFIGKSYNRQEKYHFYIYPLENGQNTLFLGCLGQDGFNTIPVEGGKPLQVKFDNLQVTTPLEKKFARKKGRVKNTLYYRVPGEANLTITLGEKVIFFNRVKISQAGTVVPYSIGYSL